MNLLFDQNISFKVAKNLQDIFPGAKHLSDLHLTNHNDIEVWNYAKANDFCIVTNDSDFIDISTLKGSPPKIIWLRIGNTSTDNIQSRFRNESVIINEFLNNTDLSFLELK